VIQTVCLANPNPHYLKPEFLQELVQTKLNSSTVWCANLDHEFCW